jgi:uncharacterized protein (TIGR03437 family)
VITTFAGDGRRTATGDGGPATDAGLGFLKGVAVGPAGDIFVFDFGGVRRIDSEGIITRVGGTGGSRLGDGGPLELASFRGIDAITFASTGEMYLVDQLNHRVRAVSVADVVETIAGSDHLSGDGGPATDAALFTPRAVTLDAVGNLYIADSENAAVRRVGIDGVIETVAGGAAFAALGDGGPAVGARLRGLLDIAIHPNGELYIADTSAARVRRVDASGVITTVAGGASFQSTGDGGLATEAGLRFPQRITIDSAGNLYIADLTANVVRKVDASGIINTVVGNGTNGFSGDGGPATEAEINRPRGIVALATGDLYVAEGTRIRHVNPAGVINTLVELPFLINSMSRTRSGDLLVTSSQSSTLYRVGLEGTSERFGGFPFGFSGDEGPADEARAKILSGALEAPDGRIFLVDPDNHRIRLLDPGTSLPAIVLPSNGLRQAASFAIGNVAAESIASLFGTNLAFELKVAEATPLPTQLGGAQVVVRDSAGTERVSELFFVSPTQINFLVPAGTASGSATLIARRADGQEASIRITVASAVPGLFSTNSNGSGVAAAFWLRVDADMATTSGAVFELDAQQTTWVGAPLDLGAESDQVFLTLFGTGIRGNSDVHVFMNGIEVPVLFAGAHPTFVGLDQVNIGPIPRSLIGAGEVAILLTAGNLSANEVTVTIQ